MSWILDTNTVVFCLRGTRPSVMRRLVTTAASAVKIPMQVRAELLVGAAKSARAGINRATVLEFISPFELVAADTAIVDRYVEARVALEKAGQRIGEADLWVAATALESGSTLVTNNTDEFSRVPGLKVEDWSL